MLRTFLIQHLPNPIGPEPVLSGPISSSRPTGYSQAAIELMGFKKGIKRERSIYHYFTCHIAQASQATHGSPVDRGANGGLAGSDVRILSRSSRKCTVTRIDSHELQGLDVVQCTALVQTNHSRVNLIMNEYACYGKGHTIHSSGQIEWFKNSVDDRSVQVGGKQRICTIDG